MSDRWIPVLSAAVGVIGGLGGAVIGAAAANENKESELKSERRAELRVERREAYGNYLGIAEDITGKWKARKKPQLEKIFVAQAFVSIVGSGSVNGAAQRVTDALTVQRDSKDVHVLSNAEKFKRYQAARKKFIKQVRLDIGT